MIHFFGLVVAPSYDAPPEKARDKDKRKNDTHAQQHLRLDGGIGSHAVPPVNVFEATP